MRDLLRYGIGALAIIGAVASVQYVQARFDRSDERSAVEVVREFRPAGETERVDDLIADRHGVPRSDLHWRGELTSGCFGHIRVVCEVPRGPEYVFDVDINRIAIHPGNAHARSFLSRFERGSRS